MQPSRLSNEVSTAIGVRASLSGSRPSRLSFRGGLLLPTRRGGATSLGAVSGGQHLGGTAPPVEAREVVTGWTPAARMHCDGRRDPLPPPPPNRGPSWLELLGSLRPGQLACTAANGTPGASMPIVPPSVHLGLNSCLLACCYNVAAATFPPLPAQCRGQPTVDLTVPWPPLLCAAEAAVPRPIEPVCPREEGNRRATRQTRGRLTRLGPCRRGGHRSGAPLAVAAEVPIRWGPEG